VREAELRLAKRLVDELRVDEFDPMKHYDAFRARLEQAAREKAKGRTLEGRPANAAAGWWNAAITASPIVFTIPPPSPATTSRITSK
jgi:non-homologous end joining protein Ku